MASFLRQTFSTLFLTFVFVIIFAINPSYGDYDDPEEMPLRGTELAMLICNHTWYNKFCVDKLTPAGPDARASDITNSALRLAQTAADNTGVVITNLLEDPSSSMKQQERRILQKCQLDNNVTSTNILAAGNDLNSDSINSMIEDINTAGNATKSCQDIIKKTRFSASLSDKNMDVIRLCEICVVSTQFYTFEDFY
ncbi:Pectinesterase inhibitor [Corchorus olitorius]|uniref:Pectinesterase inhibitor n=1 Tax=Corchorus olitorius TaxID=93759 RepID=A0A1R3JR40_9ROSI|nr:Pectinesterase inhibitor [Corchorus olitorius]